jgi:hypothetical protein
MAQEFLNGLEAAAHIMYCLTKRFVLAFYPAFHSKDKAFIKLKWYQAADLPQAWLGRYPVAALRHW